MWQERARWFDDVKKKVLTRALTRPTPAKLLVFFVLCLCFLAKEADWTNFESKFLVGIPKVSEHHIDDRNLIDFGSVDLQNCLSVALPRL